MYKIEKLLTKYMTFRVNEYTALETLITTDNQLANVTLFIIVHIIEMYP